MSLSRRLGVVATAGALPLAVLTLAACGGGNTATAAKPAPAKTSSGASATIGVASNGQLGKILVDSQGRTIYLFQKDTGMKSTCTGACAAAWPPVRATGKPTVGAGLSAAKVGTTPRSDGKPQVTYNGHPLYLYAADANAGDTNGQGINGFGAPWYVLSPAGNSITSSGGSSGSSGGGGGVY
jgi:predicted lipoprotein with Yx(FWY)xxD motif